MKKVFFSSFVATTMMFFVAGLCFANNNEEELDSFSVGVGQNQNQNYDGWSWVERDFGTTYHGGAQDQENWGWTAGGRGSEVSAGQSQEQSHNYGSVHGGLNNWTGQSGGSFMSSGMSGDSHWWGGFSAYGGQNYDAMIDSGNTVVFSGISAVSSMEDSFGQEIAGGAWGHSNVSNYVNLSAENSYAQMASRGNDWAYHSGNSSTEASLAGSASHGAYWGSVGGSQSGGTETYQSSNGTFQSGSQNASASIAGSVGSWSMGGASLSASMSQSHSYQQYNAGLNGWQYQNGTVSTHVSVRDGSGHRPELRE